MVIAGLMWQPDTRPMQYAHRDHRKAEGESRAHDSGRRVAADYDRDPAADKGQDHGPDQLGDVFRYRCGLHEKHSMVATRWGGIYCRLSTSHFD